MVEDQLGEHEIPGPKNPLLSDKLYIKLEYLARVVLPAAATLYGTLAALWHAPFGVEIVGTLVAVDTFLGVFLGIAQKSYDNSEAKYDGNVTAIPTENGTMLSNLVLNEDPSGLDTLRLKVEKQAS